MLFVNFFLNIITYLALIIMTVCSVPLFFWLLFIKKTSRFPIASKLIFGPWSFIINRVLCHINLKIRGQEFVDKKRKTIYICNHQSWLDITTFINSTGAVPISKEEVKKIPFLGMMIVYNGPIYLQRNNTKDRLGIIKEVRELFSDEKRAQSLCFFPEGTRSINGELQAPNLALIKLAYKMNVPVVPAAINGTINVLPKGKIFIRGFKKVTLEYTQPILPSDYPDSNSFSEACWERVKTTYDKLVAEG